MDILKNHKNQINPVFRMFNIEFLSISPHTPASIMGPLAPPHLDPGASGLRTRVDLHQKSYPQKI